MNDKKLYQEYIDLANKLSDLEAKKKVIAEQILKKMTAEKIYKVEGESGIITKAIRNSWVYTEEVIKKTNDLKELKKIEEKTGVAQKQETEFLRVSLR